MTRLGRPEKAEMAESLSIDFLNQTGAIFVKKVVAIAASSLILQELESVPAVEALVVLVLPRQALAQCRLVHFC